MGRKSKPHNPRKNSLGTGRPPPLRGRIIRPVLESTTIQESEPVHRQLAAVFQQDGCVAMTSALGVSAVWRPTKGVRATGYPVSALLIDCLCPESRLPGVHGQLLRFYEMPLGFYRQTIHRSHRPRPRHNHPAISSLATTRCPEKVHRPGWENVNRFIFHQARSFTSKERDSLKRLCKTTGSSPGIS